jgi:hypothetical protein
MIPVYQTKFGSPQARPEEQGNCYAACVASIFELTLEDVPDESPARIVAFYKAWDAWFAERGLAPYYIKAKLHTERVPGWSIGTVRSNMGAWNHAVVCLDGRVVHDPNPNFGPDTYKAPMGYEAFVVINPAEVVRWSKTCM